MSDVRWLNFPEAAKRVGRSTRAIKYWHQGGMPMDWRVGADNQRERVVREDVLLKWWRDRMTASPVHQYRARRIRREAGLPELPVTVTEKHARNAQNGPQLREKREQTPSPGTDGPDWDFAPPGSVKPLRGEPEYTDLHEALRTAEPACRGNDAFTADKLTADEAVTMAGICAGCDVLEQCRAFAAVNRPEVGFWAGQPSWRVRASSAA